MFACMQAAFVYTSIGSCRPCVHTLFNFFFDNVSHESGRVSCVCSYAQPSNIGWLRPCLYLHVSGHYGWLIYDLPNCLLI